MTNAEMKKAERKELLAVRRQLRKLDEVECEYYFDKNDNDAPVIIFHQDASTTPLFILRPEHHCMLEIKNIFHSYVEDFDCWEDACFEGTKDYEFIMKFYENYK